MADTEPGLTGAPLPLSLRRNFYWTFVGNVVYAGCQWGMLVVLAKVTPPEKVGEFALGLAVTAPVVMFTNLQLRSVQATDARREYVFGDYLSLRLVMTALAMLVIGAVVVVTGYDRESALVIMALGLAKSFESISDVIYGLLQQRERMDRIAQSMMIKGPLSLVILGMGVYLTHSVLCGAIGLALSWALVLVTYDARSARLLLRAAPSSDSAPASQASGQTAPLPWLPRWEPATLWRLAWLSLPLGLVMMLISLNTNTPRYFVEQQLGSAALGIFAAIAYLMVAGTNVVSALGQSASPRLAKYYADGQRPLFRNLLLRLIIIGSLLGAAGTLVACIAGKPILNLIYRPEYAERADVFAWMMVTTGVAYVASFLGYAMTAARYFRAQIPLFALITASTAAACWVLVPRYGLLGATWAMLIGASVQAIGSLAVVLYALRRPGPPKEPSDAKQ